MKTGTSRTMVVMVLAMAACQDSPFTPRAPESEGPRVSAARRPEGAEGYGVPGELRRGFILGRNGQPREITYEVQDGLAVIEGDIILGPANLVPSTLEELQAASRSGADNAQGAIVDGAGVRWPAGIVPFSFSEPFVDHTRVFKAMEMIERSTAGVLFVPRDGQSNSLKFHSNIGGCSSLVGMAPLSQIVVLEPDCTVGNTAHELLHALGIFHEQSRCDRDLYVSILTQNILPGHEHNFDLSCDYATDFFEYDEGSMMHYDPFAWSANGEPTIVSKRGRDADMGQRAALSLADVNTVNVMYGEFNEPPTAVIAPLANVYPEGTPILFDGSGSSDPDDRPVPELSLGFRRWHVQRTSATAPLHARDSDADLRR